MPRTALQQVFSPRYRYQHARLIHATRVAFAVLAAILLTTVAGLPHGEWATITVLIVIGGLQHQGNIRRKAIERGWGTLIGAAAGLALIAQQSTFGLAPVTFLLIAAACGICAYYAIGKAGYIALLSAVTIIIVGGNGDNSLDVGLWRTVNILIGIVIALLFSFAIPLYATWSWRYQLAQALRGCAALHAGLANGGVSGDKDLQAMAAQGALLVKLRSLLPWVAKETHIDAQTMEEIQRSLRLCVSTLDLMTGLRRRVGAAQPVRSPPACDERATTRTLLGMARALELGKTGWLQPRRAAEQNKPAAPPLDGHALLDLQFHDEVRHLQSLLAATENRWNI